jgi:hypothetical protein
VLAACGDGVVDDGEECDDGDGNADEVADACRLDCVAPTCGDGVLDADEMCDPATGPRTSPDACLTCEQELPDAGGPDAGGDGGAADGGVDADAADGSGSTPSDDGGCRVGSRDRPDTLPLWLLALGWLVVRGRRRSR